MLIMKHLLIYLAHRRADSEGGCSQSKTRLDPVHLNESHTSPLC